MQGFETKFCQCCSLPPKGLCKEQLYNDLTFYNYEQWANKNCPKGKQCDVLYHKGKKVILIELKALDKFIQNATKETLEEFRNKLCESLKDKFIDSKNNLYKMGKFKDCNFSHYIVAFSKRLVDYYGRYTTLDLPSLKYYLQNRFFFSTYVDGKTIAVVRECGTLRDYFS